MKLRKIDREHRLHVIAGAVLVALGSSQALAQQAGSEQEGSRLESQQSQLEQDAQSQRDALESQQSQLEQDVQSQRDALESQQGETAQTDSQSSGASEQLDRIAEEHDDLSTFVEAVKAAGMADSLTSGTDYTVFAPTNEAFEQMSGMSTEELLRAENRDQLISVLRAHIVADDVDEEMARSLQQAQTIDGGTIDLSASEDSIQVGDAQVVQSGIQEGSLRVYAIDQVLEPTALARADDLGADQAGQSDLGAGEQESESESELESELESETDSLLDSESESEIGSERDDPFGSEGAQLPSEEPGADDRIGAGSPQ